jgi:aspartate/methionine/tyrosine aminotransferase
LETMMNIAHRMAKIEPFHVMELMAKAKALEVSGRSILHLEVGEPDFPTAEPIVAAGVEFLRQGHVHYTPALGLPELREAISNFYAERYKLNVPAERIIVTAGASGALLLALGVLVNPGSEWLQPDPGYPCNRHFISLFEGLPRAVAVSSDTAYQPTLEQLRAHWRSATRGLIVASPSNPTGTLLTSSQLQTLWDEVRERSGTLIVDEIYHGLTYGVNAASALALSEDIFVINSFSKYFGMTGWRLGWLVAPDAYVNQIEKLAQNLFICPSAIAQHAALAAFRPTTISILEQRRQLFSQRRDLLLKGLRGLGFKIDVEPQGAFYIYADIRALSSDSFYFAHQLLTDAGVAATPGVDFGGNHSAAYMRFAYTLETAGIEEALDRISRFLGTRKKVRTD